MSDSAIRQFTEDEEWALRIITNPSDLQISLTQRKTDGKYGFIIIRGPGCCFQMIFRSEYFAETLDEVVDAVEGFLEEMRGVIDQLLTELGDGPGAQFTTLCLVDGECEMLLCREMKLVDADLIGRIGGELRENMRVATFNMKLMDADE